MKKLTAFLLALALMGSLAACGSGDTNASTPATPAEPSTSADAAAPEAVGDVASDPVVNLTASSAFSATQLTGIFWEYFEEQVESLSGGSIQLDLYLGGTLCGPDEEMEMLSNGSIDMMMCFTPANAFSVPSIASIYYTPGTMEQTQDVMKHILFEDEASSAAIQADISKNNATMLPSFVVTSNIVFCSKQPATCWADLYEDKFGCPMDANYSDMGYKNLVTVMDAEWYESMRTGLVDNLQVTAADIVNEKLYEVADYFIVCPAYRVDHWMLMNTDKLNSLTDNQRAVLEQACENLMAYTITYQSEVAAEFEATVTANGGTILDMTEEETEWFLYCGNILGWKSGLETLAVATDSVDAMSAVQAANREAITLYTEYDMDALAAKYGG